MKILLKFSAQQELLMMFMKDHDVHFGGFLMGTLHYDAAEFAQFVAEKTGQTKPETNSASVSEPTLVNQIREVFPETWLWTNSSTGY